MRLNRDKRYQIKALLDVGHKQKAIAKQIGISEGGLSREISRNGGCKKYDPEKADKRAVKLQHKAHVHYKYGNDVWNEVEDSVMEDWSPDEVVGRRKNNGQVTPSVPTIYKMLKNKPELEPYLRHLGKPYRKRGPVKGRRGFITGQVSIDLRPAIVDKKCRFGDFEIDLINGAHYKGIQFTANDRMSGFCILEPFATKDATDLANTSTRIIPGSEARTRT